MKSELTVETKPVELVFEIFEGNEIAFQVSDAFVNATVMCKGYGKRPVDFLRLPSAEAFQSALSEDLGIMPDALVIARQGGNQRVSPLCENLTTVQGTWLHPDLALESHKSLHRGFGKAVRKKAMPGIAASAPYSMPGIAASAPYSMPGIAALRRINLSTTNLINTMTTNNTILSLQAFGDIPIRVYGEPDAQLFVAADVCRALDLSNPSVAVAALDDDERAKLKIGRQGEVNVITESGLYALMFRCRDAMTPGTRAHKFRKWVTSEVIPSVRKTGELLCEDRPPRFRPSVPRHFRCP